MDKRLQLTEKQKELATKFDLLCEEMKREGIGFIGNVDDVLLINLNHVEDWVDPDEMLWKDDEGYEEELVDFEEMYLSHINFFYTSGCLDDNMGIRYKK